MLVRTLSPALGLLIALVSAGCADRSAPADASDRDAAIDGLADAQGPDPVEKSYLTTLASPADYAVLAASGEVKYLAAVKGHPAALPDGASCVFQNTRRYSWHLQFLQSLPMYAGLPFDAYTSLVTRQGTRRLWAGALKTWPTVQHPLSKKAGILSFSIYGEAGSVDSAAISEVLKALAACAPFSAELLVFVPDTPELEALVREHRELLLADGIACLLPSELTQRVTFLPHAYGEGYGTLRMIPKGSPLTDYGPRDVVVVESAPNDISIVAGLVTKNPQNQLGHVNLRLGEKHIPNVTVPGIYDSLSVQTLDGSLVHLLVNTDRFVLEPASLADAQAFWSAHRPQVRPPVANLAVTAVSSYRDLRAAHADAFGVKAANLAELVRVLDPAHRNEGFAIPFARYHTFMKDAGLAATVDALATDPRMRSDAPTKRSRLKDLRARIRAAAFPTTWIDDVAAAARSSLGEASLGQRLRFRSSTNVEDLDAFTGAGLYESKTGCYADEVDGDQDGPSRCLGASEQASLQAELDARRAELAAHPERTWLNAIIEDLVDDTTEEKPLSEAIKKVWASLWNECAFDEREYYGIDHRLAQMGIAVTLSFVEERANAVAVTNLKVDNGLPLYRLNSQAGTESVVQPEDPTAVAELLTFRRADVPPIATDLRILTYSNRVPEGTMVWPAPALEEVSRLLFVVHDHFAAQVYASIASLRLDIELKLSRDGQVVFKQVRPYVYEGDKP